MDEIRIGIGVSSIGRFLPLIGKAAGLFERENISVEIVNQQDEEKVVEEIVTKETPVGTPNAPSLIFSLLNGNDLVIVGGGSEPSSFLLGSKPKHWLDNGSQGEKNRHQSAAPHGGHGYAGVVKEMGSRYGDRP
jgi:hypothetical protein